ncbi:hypothetical protein OESDEN_05991 [Oesophagostomum dentatum]|uniref:Uncharacterized protein n=1 Tax=Oesophagostomum dentatum TaxID=61180 RepID=A0A0B1T953_OESDE|nr:hypothetical protein OESDEN_05991 [Oesophagostomum dentatum]
MSESIKIIIISQSKEEYGGEFLLDVRVGLGIDNLLYKAEHGSKNPSTINVEELEARINARKRAQEGYGDEPTLSPQQLAEVAGFLWEIAQNSSESPSTKPEELDVHENARRGRAVC